MATEYGSSVTIDESTGQQNAQSSTSLGDNTDNDTSLPLPAVFQNSLSTFSQGAPLHVALSGYNGSNSGADVITFTGTSIGFCDSLGSALNGLDSGMRTTADSQILLFTDPDNNNILYGKSGATLVFAAYLEETGDTTQAGAKIWMVQYEAIQHNKDDDADDVLSLTDKVYVSIQENLQFSLADSPAGNNLFLMLGNANVGIVVTGKNPANQSEGTKITTGDTINTSQGGGNTTIGVNNQMIDANGNDGNEGIYLTFVKSPNPDFTIPNLNQAEAKVESNIQFDGLTSVNTASFQVVQLQSGKTATVTITAIDVSTTDPISGAMYVDKLTNGSTVDITGIVVRDENGAIVSSPTLTVSIVDGIATVKGIKKGYTIEYQTSTDHNRLLIENTGSGTDNASFDVGGFSIGSYSQSTVEIGSMMKFEDDGPSVTTSTNTTSLTLKTQDAETIGASSNSDNDDFSTIFTATPNYGADGEGSLGWTYELAVATANDSGLSSNGDAIKLYLINAKVVGSTASLKEDVTVANTIFDVAVSTTGQVTLQQFAEIDHATPDDEEGGTDETQTMVATKITLRATATITDGDGDTDSDTETLNIGDKLLFEDDGPSVTTSTNTTSLTLKTQDAATIGASSNSDNDDFSTIFTATPNYGADGEGSLGWTYELAVDIDNGSGLSSNGDAIKLYLINKKVVGSTASLEADVTEANTIFDVAVSTTGQVTLQQFAEIDHATPDDEEGGTDETQTMVATKITLSATATITDGDDDTDSDTETLNIGDKLLFEDDTPSVSSIDDLVGDKDDLTVEGSYNFSVGADAVGNENADGIVLDTLTGTAGGRDIDNAEVSFESEDDESVVYTFNFDYYSGPAETSTQSASGTVTFHKTTDGSSGNFEFELDSPIVRQTTFSTSLPQESYFYNNLGNKSPEIVVQQYSSNFFGVFSAFIPMKPSNKNDLTTVDMQNGKDRAFVQGDVFSSQKSGYVNVATDTVGINSDSIQRGEVLNLDFYTANPVNSASSQLKNPSASIDTATGKAYADTIKITLNQIIIGEDIAVLLKLYNADREKFATKLIIVNSALDYEAVGKDKVVTIGKEDYDYGFGGEGYQIYGVQILTSTENITGKGYSLQDHTEINLTSDGKSKGYANTSDSDVIKIIKIEVVTETTTNYDVDLNFSGNVIDDDADDADFDFDVHLDMDGVDNLNTIGVTTTPVDILG